MSRGSNNTPSKSRSIGYHFDCGEREFDEPAMEKLLERAKAAGVIYEFDTGRGHIVWFSGWPGEPLRVLRDQVLAMLPLGTVSLLYPLKEAR